VLVSVKVQKVVLCPMTRCFRAMEPQSVYGACEVGNGEGEDPSANWKVVSLDEQV
jgi:hypothetical protein